MRNLKKILALALALVMTLSLMTVANAFNDDADIDAKYDEAVTVLSNLKVFQGVNDGSNFAPKQTISRGEVAAIIYRIVTGDVSNTNIAQHAAYAAQAFDDVKATDWDAGYIGYCANAQIIVGDGTNFYPRQEVNGYQALAMILRAIGYDANKEFQGEGWEIRTASTAQQLGLLKNIGATSLNGPASREMVAEILFRTIAEAYVVKYTSAFGYQPVVLPTSGGNTTGNIPLFGNYTAATLGYRTFGLEKTSGEITAVGRKAGTTQLGSTVVAGTSTPWTDIGYAAYAYTVPTSGSKARTAVSDVTITGKSLLTVTDGTVWNDMLKKVTLDTEGYDFYYNGVLASTWNGKTWTNVNATANSAFNAAIGDRGVKVDFIDNDNGGKAEAVVVTEYTVADVTGKTAGTTTGTNATAADRTYFTPTGRTTSSVLNENVVASKDLVVGDLVTYVDYQGLDTVSSRYATVAPYAADTFKQINRYVNADVSYVIGDATLYTSDLTAAADIAALAEANLNKTMGYYVDEFGYVIRAGVVVAPNQYLFGVTNNHWAGITFNAAANVVMVDGSVPSINIATVNGKSGLINNMIRGKMYAYTVNAAGNYVLTDAGTAITDVTYTQGQAGISLNNTAYYVNNQTVVVDVTGVMNGTATQATVYTGYANIPSMEYAQGYYLDNGHGYVSLMFVYNYGVNTADSFYIYDTNPYSVTSSPSGLQYTYKVVRQGDVESGLTVTVDAAGKAVIDAHGVGYYTINKAGEVASYTSFVELMSSLTWGNGTIVNGTNSYGVTYGAYTWDETTTFTVFDVVNKSATNFTLVSGSNFWYNNTSVSKGFVIDSNRDGKADNIYVVVGPVANGATSGAKMTKETAADGSSVEYYVCDKYVTGVARYDATTYKVTLDGNVYYAAVTQNDKVSLPVSVTGTGYKVTVGGKVSYLANGEPLTITGDTTVESGYVAWTLNGVTKPVAYQNAGVAPNTVFTDIKGTYVHYTKNGGTGYGQVGMAFLYPNEDSTLVDNYYLVTVSNWDGTDSTEVVYVNNVAMAYPGSNTFYVKGTDTVRLVEDSGEIYNSDKVGGITNNLTIGFTA